MSLSRWSTMTFKKRLTLMSIGIGLPLIILGMVVFKLPQHLFNQDVQLIKTTPTPSTVASVTPELTPEVTNYTNTLAIIRQKKFNVAESNELWLVSVDGLRSENLQQKKVSFADKGIDSPYVFIEFNYDDMLAIYVLDLRTRKLTNTQYLEGKEFSDLGIGVGRFRVSPDGNSFAYYLSYTKDCSQGEGGCSDTDPYPRSRNGVYVYSLLTKKSTYIGSVTHGDYSWSPDSKGIYVTNGDAYHDRDLRLGFYYVDVSTFQITKVKTLGKEVTRYLNYQEGGVPILFTNDRKVYLEKDNHLIQLDAKESQPITALLSPNGRYVVFEDLGVKILDVKENSLKQLLFSNKKDGFPDYPYYWLDESTIMLRVGTSIKGGYSKDLYRVTIASGELTRITSFGDIL